MSSFSSNGHLCGKLSHFEKNNWHCPCNTHLDTSQYIWFTFHFHMLHLLRKYKKSYFSTVTHVNAMMSQLSFTISQQCVKNKYSSLQSITTNCQTYVTSKVVKWGFHSFWSTGPGNKKTCTTQFWCTGVWKMCAFIIKWAINDVRKSILFSHWQIWPPSTISSNTYLHDETS